MRENHLEPFEIYLFLPFHFISFLQQKPWNCYSNICSFNSIQPNASTNCSICWHVCACNLNVRKWYYHCVRWDSLPNRTLFRFLFNDWFIFEFPHTPNIFFRFFFSRDCFSSFHLISSSFIIHWIKYSSINLSIQIPLLVWLFEQFIYIFLFLSSFFLLLKWEHRFSDEKSVRIDYVQRITSSSC